MKSRSSIFLFKLYFTLTEESSVHRIINTTKSGVSLIVVTSCFSAEMFLWKFDIWIYRAILSERTFVGNTHSPHVWKCNYKLTNYSCSLPVLLCCLHISLIYSIFLYFLNQQFLRFGIPSLNYLLILLPLCCFLCWLLSSFQLNR